MSDSTLGLSPDEKIIQEVKNRFRRAEEWEAEFRVNFIADSRFAAGDSQNGHQWPSEIMRDRTSSNRPCLTVNKTKTMILQVVNDQRQNPSQIQVRPVGNGATYDAAKIYEGICRHIEYQSNAQQAYNNACYHQVIGGIGYWRVVCEYEDSDSFNQEIFIRRIADPMSVYLDTDLTEADGSDANWGILFKEMPRDEFEVQFPGEEDITSLAPLGIGTSYDYSMDSWNTRDFVRLAEYFRREMKHDVLHELANGSTMRRSDARRLAIYDEVKANTVRTRDIETPEIEWFLIGGARILDRKPWPGRYIPIIRVIGEERVIDKRMDRIGLTRCLLDPQRIYNYWTSSAVEQVALQTKTPFITPVEAISGFEENWARANIDNKAYLPWNQYDSQGQKLERPERAPVPTMSQAYLDGMRISAGELMMASGIYEANLGMKSNEVSGKAVDARQRQGSNATYHFIDRFANSIRYTGRILIDLIPKIYDTKRVISIMAADGDTSSVHLDPAHPVAHTQLQDEEAKDFDVNAIRAVFNPTVGKYDVEADIGPAFATRRQETFAAISTILSENPSLTAIIGDLMFKAADFPMADEIAERMHNMLPPQATGQGPDPQVQQLQQMLAQQHQKMSQQEQDLAKSNMELAALKNQRMIEEYKAETDRMKAVGTIDPEAMKPIIRQLVSEALGTHINPIIHQHAVEAAQLPQPPAPEGSNGTA